MLYWSNKGKYQKAYDFLWKKLIPLSGKAKNELGEALRLTSRVYYRYYNDGDSYDTCIEEGMIPDFSKKIYPFDKEYRELGLALDSLLSSGEYDKASDIVLIHIMLSLSSESNIYNPNSNRLVPIDSSAGRNAFKLLDLNTVFINFCGKNEEWLPTSLRKEGVKISKTLSEETRKELKCDTIKEFYHEQKSRYGKKSVKVTLSKDNSILSKKFSNIEKQHKKSVKEYEKGLKERRKARETNEKKMSKRRIKNYEDTKVFYKYLSDLTVNRRLDSVKNSLKAKVTKSVLIKMLLTTLINYKEKKVTLKSQRENKKEVIEKLTKGLNEAGKEILKTLEYYDSKNTLYSSVFNLYETLDKKLDDLLVEIYGSSEAVDSLYNRCKY